MLPAPPRPEDWKLDMFCVVEGVLRCVGGGVMLWRDASSDAWWGWSGGGALSALCGRWWCGWRRLGQRQDGRSRKREGMRLGFVLQDAAAWNVVVVEVEVEAEELLGRGVGCLLCKCPACQWRARGTEREGSLPAVLAVVWFQHAHGEHQRERATTRTRTVTLTLDH